MKKNIVIVLIILMLISIPLFARLKVKMGVILDENTKEQYGVLIKKVSEESPAEKAGLHADDILLKIDGDKIYTIDQVKKMLSFFESGQNINITYKRGENTKTCLLQLEEQKTPEVPKRTYMGVFLKDLDEETRKNIKLMKPFGIMISEVVKDSPADKAGLKDEDVLLTFAGEKIFTVDQLIKMLQNFKPENEIKLKILRGKKTKIIKIVLGEKEDDLNYFLSGKDDSFNFDKAPKNVLFYKYDIPDKNKWIGVELELNKQETIKDGEKVKTTKTIVKKVIKGTQAEKAGLKEGDVIIAVENDKNLEIGKAIQEKEIGDKITLTVERNGKVQDFAVEIGERKTSDSEENVKVTIDNGEIKVLINGVATDIGDLENIYDELGEIKIIKHIKMEGLDDVGDDLKKVKDKLKGIDLNIEILNTNDEL